MSFQNICTSHRFSCHFLEADGCEDANDGAVLTAGPALQPGNSDGAAVASTAAGGLVTSRPSSLKFAVTPPERSAVIPPMKRRLITLSTAGNLKISPLSNQQLHHHRIYPIRRPSLDGAANRAAAAPAPEAREPAGSQQSQPPPPPSTPSRHPHTPNSHLEGIRWELSPRDDNILHDVYHHVPSSPEPPQPPLPPATPRGMVPRVGGTLGGGDGGDSGCFTMPRLVLRPVRPLAKPAFGEGSCGAQILVLGDEAAFSGGVAAPAAHGLHSQQPQSKEEAMTIAATRLSATGGSSGGDGFAPMDVDADGSQLAEPWRSGPSFPHLQIQQPHSNHRENRYQQQDHPHHEYAQCFHADLRRSRNQRLPLSETADLLSGGDSADVHAGAAVAAAATVATAAAAEGGDSGGELDAAAAAVAAAAMAGLTWTTIEVTVAVRPKAGGSKRSNRVGPGGIVHEMHNGYMQGPACGVFDLTRYLTGRDCVRHCGRWISRSQFEKVGGSTMAKWYRSIRVLPDLEPLGEWLERHDMPVLRGPARRSRKRAAADSDDEMVSWHCDEAKGPDSAWGIGAAATGATGTGALVAAASEQDTSTAAPGSMPPPSETLANRMLLQQRDGSGGDDLLVQRLLSTWPLSQPFLRPPLSSTAASTVAAAAAEPPPAAVVTPRCFTEANGSRGGAAKPHHGPLPRPSALGDAHGASPPLLPATASDAPSTFAMALLGRARVSGMQLSISPQSPRLFQSHPQPDSARKPLLAQAAAEQHGTMQAQWMQSDGPSMTAVSGMPPPLLLPPPRGQQLEDHRSAPGRPRLLLHRTAAAGPDDGRGAAQPYLFAVQAPPGMLYRAAGGGVAASGSGLGAADAGAVLDSSMSGAWRLARE
uniref:RlsA n=1 Tax=Pleodorina californica TaxID=47285 RepID=A0A1W5IWT5_9CHLO|nr:RlsA [Pleodorina californica]